MMIGRLFRPRSSWSEAAEARYAAFELVYTAVDVVAGVLFVVGSTLFLVGGHDTLARILFLCGSTLFVAKPVIRFGRELALLGEEKTGELAAKGGAHAGRATGGSRRQGTIRTPPSGTGEGSSERRGSHTRSRGGDARNG